MIKALILIDIQHDFLPGGALAVPDGDSVIAIANRLMPNFDLVVATQDWHPKDHGSFAANHPGKKPGEVITLAGQPQMLWPTHCVQNTPGAALATTLDRTRIGHITQKGMNPTIDSYSGFFDNGHKQSTDLHPLLQTRAVTDLYLVGLATDYCVKFTALDARRLNFNVHLVLHGCRGVNLCPSDVDNAIAEMRRAGVSILDGSTDEMRFAND